jgi:geranylgeranyl reductase family protein
MSSPTRFDAAVVGGGPAGCHAARRLAGEGLRVLLLEGQRFPRWKPCAGGLTAKIEPYLAPELRALCEREIDGSHVSFGDDRDVHVRPGRRVGWMVHRERFDQVHFAAVAALPGVEAVEGCRVREVREEADGVAVETSRGVLRARAAVGADGVAGVTARTVRPRLGRRLGVAYEGELAVERQELTHDAVFDLASFRGGYGWIFPKAEQYSIGGYVYGRKAPGLRDDYDRFRAGSRWLTETRELRTRGHGVPAGGTRDRLDSRSIVLAGDAADTVDPLTGEGIYYAFRTAHLAAEAITAHLREGSALDAYTARVQREIHADFRWARRIAGVVYRFPRTAYAAFFRNALVCRWTTEILTGQRTYRALLGEALRNLHRLPGATARGGRRATIVWS